MESFDRSLGVLALSEMINFHSREESSRPLGFLVAVGKATGSGWDIQGLRSRTGIPSSAANAYHAGGSP